MIDRSNTTRRGFIGSAALAGAGILLIGCGDRDRNEAKQDTTGGKSTMGKPEAEAEVTPTEDLMREHGLLNRILLIYDESRGRLAAGSDFPIETLAGAAAIVRRFVEDYHEKLEEDHIFPRFKKAGELADLVDVLDKQHDAGRKLTDTIKGLATAQTLKDADARAKLAAALTSFNRMYRPHEAREDTVLFPALRSIVSANEFDSMGEEFEDKERELFGADGFESMVAQVAALEKNLGIDDLSRFTPAT
jgi:hemerythrin-like domain-containing protein